MSASDPRGGFRLLNKSADLIRSMGWTGLGKSAMGTALLAVLLSGIDLMNAIISVPIQILQALGVSVAELNAAFFGGLADYIGSVLGATANAFGGGWTGLLGPFQGPLGVGVFLLMLWEVAYYLDLVDSDFLGIVFDAPDFLLESDDSGVADEEE